MSDLNQRVKAIKVGESRSEHELGPIKFILTQFDRDWGGLICCFYTRRLRDVGNKSQKGYVDLNDFEKLSKNPNEVVIGCSRGCMPYEECSNDPRTYRDKLCKNCVQEARECLVEEGLSEQSTDTSS